MLCVRSLHFTPVLALLAGACADANEGANRGFSADTSLYALVTTVDGTFFHPPLGPTPAPTGTFDPTLLPSLQVLLEATDAAGDVVTTATFDAGSSPRLMLLGDFELYFVDVPAASYITDRALAYRFRVLSHGVELGRSDLSAIVFDVLANVPHLRIGVRVRIEARSTPHLASIAPDRVRRGASELTLDLHGANLTNDSIARLDGAELATTYVSSGQLRAQIPAASLLEAAAHGITVFTPAPGGGTSETLPFIVANEAPLLAGFTPADATAGDAGFTLEVTGSSFAAGAMIIFDGVQLATTVISADQLSAFVPADRLANAGYKTVSVINPEPSEGASAERTFTVFNAVPAIHTLSPSSANAGSSAQTVTIDGGPFAAGAVARFEGTDLSTTVVSASRITAIIPAARLSNAGWFAITVANAEPSLGASAPSMFTVINVAPQITALAPPSATVGSAAIEVAITGTGFVSGAIATLDATVLTTTFISSTELRANLPASALSSAGVFALRAINPEPNAGASAPRDFAVQHPSPQLTALNPPSAWVGGPAFTLTADGSAFVDGAQISFGGVNVATTFVSSTRLTATVPAAAIGGAGTTPVIITNPTPSNGPSAALNFSVLAAGGTTCRTILESGASTGNGVYSIDIDNNGPIAPFATYCDMDNGGWTLLAKTVAAGLTSAEQTTIRHGDWNTYTQTGYGSPDASSRLFWMPLAIWNAITTAYPNNTVRVVDDAADQAWVNLSIAGAAAHYAINWQSCGINYPLAHNLTCTQNESTQPIRGRAFTTWDADHDTWPDNCAYQNVGYNGGFWYSNCYQLSMLHSSGNLYSWTVNPGGGPVSPVPTASLHLWFRESGPAQGVIGSGYTMETAGRSCRTIQQAGHSRGDGLYWLDPDNLNTGAQPFQAYCLMTQNGGGWTLLGKTVASGVTTAVSTLIRQSLWKTYGETGYGRPNEGSSYYWMPLDQWHNLTAAFPTNVWWIQDDNNQMTHNNLSIGTRAQNYVINWQSCGAQWIVWRDGTPCLDPGPNAIRGKGFTTPDADHDTWPNNCSSQNVGYNGGFWYSNCYQVSMFHSSGGLYSWSRNPGAQQIATSQVRLWFY